MFAPWWEFVRALNLPATRGSVFTATRQPHEHRHMRLSTSSAHTNSAMRVLIFEYMRRKKRVRFFRYQTPLKDQNNFIRTTPSRRLRSANIFHTSTNSNWGGFLSNAVAIAFETIPSVREIRYESWCRIKIWDLEIRNNLQRKNEGAV